MIASNTGIINLIARHGVLTQEEIEQLLGYKKNALHNRLKKLSGIKKIRVKIGNDKKATTHYYLDKNHLEKWVEEKIDTKNLNNRDKLILRMVGIKYPSRKRKPAISISNSLHDKLKKEAEETGIPLCELVEKKLLGNYGVINTISHIPSPIIAIEEPIEVFFCGNCPHCHEYISPGFGVKKIEPDCPFCHKNVYRGGK